MKFCKSLRYHILGALFMNAYCLHEKYNNGVIALCQKNALEAYLAGLSQNSSRLLRASLKITIICHPPCFLPFCMIDIADYIFVVTITQSYYITKSINVYTRLLYWRMNIMRISSFILEITKCQTITECTLYRI